MDTDSPAAPELDETEADPEVIDGEVVDLVEIEAEEDDRKALMRGDGRNQGDPYTDAFKLRAQFYFASGTLSLSQTAKALGIPEKQVRKWKAEKEPNDEDWDELKEAWARRQFYVLADAQVETGAEAAARTVVLARVIREAVMEALTVGTLYDSMGVPVEFLTNEYGKKVLVGGLKPRTMTEVANAVRVLKMLEDERDVEAELREREEDINRGVIEWLHQILHVVGLTPVQAEKFKQTMAAMREQGKVPDALLGEGEEEETEEVDDDDERWEDVGRDDS